MAAAALRRQPLDEVRHQRSGGKDQVGAARDHRRRELAVQRRSLRSELEHVADDREAAAARPGLGRGEVRKRRPHRGRVGVEGLVDEEEVAAGGGEPDALAAPGRRAKVGEAERREREIAAGGLDGGEHRQRVHRHVAPGRADPVDERLAEHPRLDDRQLGF